MNPYVILGSIAFCLALSAGSYLKGYHVAQGEAAVKYADDLDNAIIDHNAQAEIDKTEAVQEAAREASARTRAVLIRSQTNEAIRTTPLPVVCDWSPRSFGLLANAIQAANGGDPRTTGSVSDAVRRANEPSK